MRKPRLEAFTTTIQRKPDNIDMEGVVPLRPKPLITSSNEKGQQSSGDTVIPRNHDTTIPTHRDTLTHNIRREVRKFGKEPATHRFTSEEKQLIRRVVRDFEDRKIRTGETEITRIGIHFLIDDYEQHGENSILAKVLRELHE